MIPLIKFRDYLGKTSKDGSPPVSIKASDLDDNFAAVKIQDSIRGLYKCDFSKEGTELVFRAGNVATLWYTLTVCVNGVPKTMQVLGTEPV
jgi:hypothetical protein